MKMGLWDKSLATSILRLGWTAGFREVSVTVTYSVVWETCTPSPTHPGPQQARIATSGGRPTGLFRGFLRGVSRKTPLLRPF